MTDKTFAELGLSPKVMAAIEASGYTTPTPIQADAIPVALTGRDILGIAQTGTGKTAAFTMPMISRLETGRARARMPRSLILAPTRELAAQVAQSFEKYGINHKLTVALLIGGVSMDDQVKKLDRGVDVLIATPGRLLDHFGRGRIMLMGVEILVIDEADRMLDMGFIPDIEKICKLLPPKRQTLFFSATMPAEITRLVNTFLKDPVRIEVARPATTAKTITQKMRFCPNGEDWAKREELRQLMRAENVRNAIIFCNRKRDVAILLKSLLKHGFNAGALHGDMDQKSRMETLDKFRSGEITFLAASDVAARGLDIPDVSHVFNYDLPWQSEDYVHRIGRTGRAGKEGAATSLVTLDDIKLLKDIEKITGDVPEWIGDAPTEAELEDAGRRKRGRGGRGKPSSSASGRPPRRDGERPERGERSARPERSEERTPERSRRPRPASPAPMAAEDAATDLPQIPGIGEQPDISFVAHAAEPAVAGAAETSGAAATDVATEEGARRRRRRGGRGRGKSRDANSGEQPAADNLREADAPAASTASSGERAQQSQPPRHPREPREHREPREPREARRDTPAQNANPAVPRQQPAAAPGERRATPHARDNDRTRGAAQGFADNVPAFLRRPVPKRLKVASE